MENNSLDSIAFHSHGWHDMLNISVNWISPHIIITVFLYGHIYNFEVFVPLKTLYAAVIQQSVASASLSSFYALHNCPPDFTHPQLHILDAGLYSAVWTVKSCLLYMLLRMCEVTRTLSTLLAVHRRAGWIRLACSPVHRLTQGTNHKSWRGASWSMLSQGQAAPG